MNTTPSESPWVDLSQRHNLGPAPIPGRDSHTADLQAFEGYLEVMRQQGRASTDLPLHEGFWAFVREKLRQCTEPVGFDEQGDARAIVPKGPEDVQRLIERVVALSPFIPIHPVQLAATAQLPASVVLTELFYATKAGMTAMRWAPECTRCGGPVTITDFLHELPEEMHCAGCHQANVIDSLDLVMVTFTLSPSVLYILANNYPCTLSQESTTANACFAPMPATNSGSGFRYSLGSDDQALAPDLKAGVYRMHCPVSMTDHLLTVERDATDDDVAVVVPYNISEFVATGAVTNLRNLTVPHGRIHFDIYPDTRSFFVLWIQHNLSEETLLHLPQDERGPYTSATEVISHPTFHLFDDQIVPLASNPLSIREVVLVFTDIVGSTDLYAELGDGNALTLVRQHFQEIFRIFAAKGRIVKTIGDSVMASFNSGADAIHAAHEAMAAVGANCANPMTGRPLEMRVGVHAGEALAIPVNGVNDFFGQTVNIAARVQHSAGTSQCLISADVLSQASARSALEEVTAQAGVRANHPTELKLKGIARPVGVSGFEVNLTPHH